MVSIQDHRLVVAYGVGGLSDVGRHAILAALARPEVAHVTVLTQFPAMLEEKNWKCGCDAPHSFSEEDKKRLTIFSVPSWDDKETLLPYFNGATAVVSCLGNREAFRGHRDAAPGTEAIVHAMKQNSQPDHRLTRLVAITSVGIEEDWPPLEFFRPAYYILSALFLTIAKPGFNDLTKMERLVKATTEEEIDFLFVRPVGLGEDVKPVNGWVLQKKKYEDTLHFDMAKLDCARYMVEEAIKPTRHRGAVVIGAEPLAGKK